MITPPAPILADYPDSTAVAVLDPGGQLIIDERADQDCLPGSTVKLMTAMVALTLFDDLERELTVGAGDLRRGSGKNLFAGDTLTVWDALHDLLLPSSNTAAAAIARTAGTQLSVKRPITAFMAAMNYEGRRLGLRRTRFSNATGLYRKGMSITSTAREIAHLVRAVSKDPVIAQVWSKKTYQMSVGGPQARTVDLVSTVPELGPRVLGAKTGSTPTEGVYAATALLDTGHSVAVVGTSKDDRWEILADTVGRLPTHVATEIPPSSALRTVE